MSLRNRFVLDCEALETRVMMANASQLLGADLAAIRTESLIEFDGAVYFGASAGAEGTGLWKTNGALGDASPVLSGELGASSFQNMSTVKFQNQLLFTLPGVSGSRLYLSDGTTAGTQLLASAVAQFKEIVVAGNLAYVTDQTNTGLTYVWVTDGSAGGTFRLSTSFVNRPSYEVIDDLLYFSVEGSGTGPNSNATIWTSNGTDAGTSIITTVPNKFARGFAEMDGDLFYFTLEPGPTGFLETLYRLDIPSQQVTEIAEINATQGDLIRTTVFDGQLFFVLTSADYGQELFVSDGSIGDLRVLKDINPGSNGALVKDVTIVQKDGVEKLAFSASGSFARHVWLTDGTEIGTQTVTQNFGAQNIDWQIQNVPGGIAFSASDRYHDFDVWISDLTPGGVATRVLGLNQGAGTVNYYIDSVRGVNDSLFAIYSREAEIDGDYVVTYELWEIDNLDFANPLTDLMINENSPNGTPLGFVPSNPFDDTIYYSIVKGNEQGYFSIDPDTGAITVADNTALDFETNQFFDIVVLSDNQTALFLTSEIAVRIEIADVNEGPTMLDQYFSVDENAGIQVFGHVIANDPDMNETLTYEIVSGPPTSYFAIDPSNGDLWTTDAGKLDFETQSSYQLQIRVTDSGGASTLATITIAINDLFEGVEPEAAIEDVLNAIDDFLAAGDLTNGQANPIRNLLNQALKLIADDRVAKAVEKLRSAVTRVTNLVNNGSLTSAEGMPLIDWLEAAIDELLTV